MQILETVLKTDISFIASCSNYYSVMRSDGILLAHTAEVRHVGSRIP